MSRMTDKTIMDYVEALMARVAVLESAPPPTGDDLGDHTATETLNMGTNLINNISGLTFASGYYKDIIADCLDLKMGDLDDYIRLCSASGIPYLGVIGNANLYIHNGTNFNIVHADDFTPHSAPMPIESSIDKILAIKNISDNSRLDYTSIPADTLYQEPCGKNKGYKLNKMVLHLIKTVQELSKSFELLESLDIRISVIEGLL